MLPLACEIWTKSNDPNYPKFGGFRQKVVYHVNHFSHIVGAILKEVSQSEAIKWC